MARDLGHMSPIAVDLLHREVGRAVCPLLPPGCRFVTLLFGDDLVGKFVSNADREDVVRMLRRAADLMDRDAWSTT